MSPATDQVFFGKRLFQSFLDRQAVVKIRATALPVFHDSLFEQACNRAVAEVARSGVIEPG